MTVLLPNFEQATVDRAKLTNYALSLHHPEGRHKARVFMSALGITASDGEWLATSILSKLRDAEAVLQSSTHWGQIYRVDMEITKGTRCAKVRTGWLSLPKEVRLITCFVIGDCDETA